MNEPVISDEDLVAYLDGEVDPARRRYIDARLTVDAALRARRDGLSVDTETIRRAFDDLLRDAPDMADTSAAAPANTNRLFWPSMAAACLVGALIAGSISMMRPGQQPDWQAYVASYQALYVGKTLTHLAPSVEHQVAELARVSDAIGKDISLESLSVSDGLDYKRAQILGFEGKPLVQFAFLSKVGAPMALCIIRSEESVTEPVSVGEMEGMSMASWARGGYAYMLIGGADDRIVESAARRFAAVL